jgi:hypothetical protein
LSTLERWEPQWFLDRRVVKTGFCKGDFSMTNEQQCHVITSLTLGSQLSSLLMANMTYRVLLLQGGQIFCPTLLIPEMDNETFFKGGCTWSFKKSKKSPYLRA